MILQRPRTIVGDAGFEPGTFAWEVWRATNEPPHIHKLITTSFLVRNVTFSSMEYWLCNMGSLYFLRSIIGILHQLQLEFLSYIYCTSTVFWNYFCRFFGISFSSPKMYSNYRYHYQVRFFWVLNRLIHSVNLISVSSASESLLVPYFYYIETCQSAYLISIASVQECLSYLYYQRAGVSTLLLLPACRSAYLIYIAILPECLSYFCCQWARVPISYFCFQRAGVPTLFLLPACQSFILFWLPACRSAFLIYIASVLECLPYFCCQHAGGPILFLLLACGVPFLFLLPMCWSVYTLFLFPVCWSAYLIFIAILQECLSSFCCQWARMPIFFCYEHSGVPTLFYRGVALILFMLLACRILFLLPACRSAYHISVARVP